MNLDLDNPEEFWPLITNGINWLEILQLCQENEHLVSSIRACDELPSRLCDSINRFIEEARGQICSVSAYHGCRVLNESDYCSRGIKRLERNRVIDWCKEFFGRNEEIDRVVEGLVHGYIEHGEHGVFCMKGIEPAIRNGSRHTDGSELIRTIAARLGPMEEEKYFNIGRPCFIEIRTPIKWFKSMSSNRIESLLVDLFVHHLWHALKLDWPGDPRGGGLIFNSDIPSEMIHAFHYLKENNDAKHLPPLA